MLNYVCGIGWRARFFCIPLPIVLTLDSIAKIISASASSDYKTECCMLNMQKLCQYNISCLDINGLPSSQNRSSDPLVRVMSCHDQLALVKINSVAPLKLKKKAHEANSIR